jgi:Flp pilus assembly protein TadB
LGSIFSVVMSPLGLLWSLAETYIWPAIALMTAGGVAGWMLGSPMASFGFAAIAAILLMRVEPLAAAKLAKAEAAD